MEDDATTRNGRRVRGVRPRVVAPARPGGVRADGQPARRRGPAAVGARTHLPAVVEGGRDDPVAYVRRALVHGYVDGWRRRRRIQMDPTDTAARDPRRGRHRDAEERADLRQLLLELSDRERAMVVLRYYLDCSEQEVAAALGCSVGTVKSTCSRALHRLRIPSEPWKGHLMTDLTCTTTSTGSTPALPEDPDALRRSCRPGGAAAGVPALPDRRRAGDRRRGRAAGGPGRRRRAQRRHPAPTRADAASSVGRPGSDGPRRRDVRPRSPRASQTPSWPTRCLLDSWGDDDQGMPTAGASDPVRWETLFRWAQEYDVPRLEKFTVSSDRLPPRTGRARPVCVNPARASTVHRDGVGDRVVIVEDGLPAGASGSGRPASSRRLPARRSARR